ncbi:MAG: hypothetical protein PVH28_06645 [Desulfobacterales bacterium]|jgi:hypothetical protein
MTNNLTFKIGDIGLALDGKPRIKQSEIRAAYRPFISTDDPDIALRMHMDSPEIPGGEKIFDSLPIWALYRHNDSLIIKLFETMNGLKRALCIHRDFNQADLYFTEPNGSFIDPFFGPTIELLMVNYLARIGSIIVHACGIDHGGKGLLFVGESGAGKSTLTRIWNKENGVEILSDDRIIIRKMNDQYWMYGTPWHGDAKFASPAKVKLEKVFFIKHGRANFIKAVSGTFPVLQFLKASFPPYWDKNCMEFAMKFFNDLVATVPCRELSFLPDSEIVKFVNNSL